VNIALPAIAHDFHTSLAGLQWVLNAYLIMLTALLLLGGSLGDLYGRRAMFVAGLVGFTGASLVCGLAPSAGALIAARALQGVAAALLVPGSLSIIASSFDARERGAAIGAWTGLAGVATALGPFVGGWLIEAASWRFVFLINLPLAAIAIAITLRHVPESRSRGTAHRLDVVGSLLVTAALAALSYAAIEHRGPSSVVSGVAGTILLLAFVAYEARHPKPMLPLELFGVPQFAGANLVTLAVYAALSGSMFLIVLRLQSTLHYSPVEAGGSLVPFTVIMLSLASTAGRVATRVGARLPMTIGPVFVAAGLALFSRVGPGDHFVSLVLPAICLLGIGMTMTVPPLTAAVLADVDDENGGVASGVNNAVARLAGLVAVAALPALAGIRADASLEGGLREGYAKGLWICAGVALGASVIAFATIRPRAAAARLAP
jgi:EmrB/QacA subfamily drug resistance transporter